MNKDTFIIDGLRSPIGLKNGKLIGMRPDDLAADVVKGLLDRNSSIDTKNIEDIAIGCAFPEGSQGMLMARGISIMAGIPKEAGAKVVIADRNGDGAAQKAEEINNLGYEASSAKIDIFMFFGIRPDPHLDKELSGFWRNSKFCKGFQNSSRF